MENDTNTNINSSGTDAANPNATAIVSMENLNHVANWVSTTVISAFFSSLERFSCVNVATTDPDDDDYEDEANGRPLALSANPHRRDDVSDLPV